MKENLMKTSRLLTVVFIALFVPAQAHAWSGPGHAAVAAMAYRDLAADPMLRTKLVNLLKSHPKFTTWQKEFNAKKKTFPAELDLGMFLFIRAATWPDEIRRTKIEELKPFDHPNWHFVDYPLRPPSFGTGPGPTPDDDVLLGIKESLKTLANRNADPVHVSSMIGDAGVNLTVFEHVHSRQFCVADAHLTL